LTSRRRRTAPPPAEEEPRKRRWLRCRTRASRSATQGPTPAGRDLGQRAAYFQPPSRTELPDDDFGEMVAMGESIFSNTYSHEVSGKYVGNTQVCEGCHLDAGRLAGAAPLWAARINYPPIARRTTR
jgi:thiosulfate dehydrogenase